jgi:hypothetical protein
MISSDLRGDGDDGEKEIGISITLLHTVSISSNIGSQLIPPATCDIGGASLHMFL